MSVIAVVALAAALWATPSINPLRGDSAEYLYFDRSRSVGYPAFLELVRLLTGHVSLAVPIQIVLLASSLLRLSIEFYRLTGRRAGAIILLIALVAQGGMWFAAAFIMTEGLSTALVALWLSQMLRMIECASLRGAVILIAISAIATMVRPPLIMLFGAGAILFLGMLTARDRARALLIAGAGLAAAWAATPLAQLAVHGAADTTSPFVRGVLQHTLYCDAAGGVGDRDAELVEQVTAPVRRYIATAPSEVREQLRREYSTPMRFGLIIPALGRRHGVDRRSAVDPYLAPVTRRRIVANPVCYAASAGREYARMAVFATDPTAEDGRSVRAFIEAHPPVDLPQLPLLAGDDRAARQAAAEVGNAPSGLNPPRYRLNVVAKVPILALLPFRLMFGAAALIGLFAIFVLTVRRPRSLVGRKELVPLAAMGLAFHGLLLITAIVEIGFFRYLIPLWPIACTTVALALTVWASKSRLPT